MTRTFVKWLQAALLAPILPHAQSSVQTLGASPTTSYRPLFTVPADATVGANLLANIEDPQV